MHKVEETQTTLTIMQLHWKVAAFCILMSAILCLNIFFEFLKSESSEAEWVKYVIWIVPLFFAWMFSEYSYFQFSKTDQNVKWYRGTIGSMKHGVIPFADIDQIRRDAIYNTSGAKTHSIVIVSNSNITRLSKLYSSNRLDDWQKRTVQRIRDFCQLE
jgi:hypothetical protein